MSAVLKTVDPVRDADFIQQFKDHAPFCNDCGDVLEKLEGEILTLEEASILDNLIEMNRVTGSGCPDVVFLKDHTAVIVREHFDECDDCRENVEILRRTAKHG
jgi:hypothetical protein